MSTIRTQPNQHPRPAILRLALAIGLLSALAALGVGPVVAGETSYSEQVDYVKFAPATSAACGFAVFVHYVGTVSTKLFTDANGTITRELDGSAGLHATWFSPETGKSYAYPEPGMLRTLYSGNQVGDPAIAELVGLQDGTPGARDAGFVLFPAVLVGFGPFGIPDIDVAGDPLMIAGTWNGDLRIAARCAALAPG